MLGGGSFSTSKPLFSMGTIRSFRIEAKRFDISLEVGNTKQVKIKESGKQHVNFVSLSKDGVRWLSKCVEEHVTREGEPSFLRTYRENDQGYVISRNGNNYGRFVELLAYGKGGLQGQLVIPEGQKQSGWRGFVSELRCALEPNKTVNLVASKPINMNTQQEKELNHGNKVAGGVVRLLSLAGSKKSLTIRGEISCFLTWKFLKIKNGRSRILAILVRELARRKSWDLELKFWIQIMANLR